MGIQDRDYYRKEGPSIFDALMPQGVVCRWLIGINVAVFVLQMFAQFSAQNGMPGFDGETQSIDGWVTAWFILDVDKVLHGQVWRLLTYAFLHSDQLFFMHILFNMLSLWWFGSEIEQLYGRKEFLAMYLVSALLGGVTYVVWSLGWNLTGRCLGASGAVTTMLILCALHYPRRVVHVYIVPMPIWVFAIFSIGIDSYRMMLEASGHPTGIAVVVHLAGAAFAVAYYKLQWSITETLSRLLWWRYRPRSRARLKLFNPDPEIKEPVAVSVHQPEFTAVDEHLEAKLDAVLEKMAKFGKESLTPGEQAILKQAAEMYKKRRN